MEPSQDRAERKQAIINILQGILQRLRDSKRSANVPKSLNVAADNVIVGKNPANIKRAIRLGLQLNMTSSLLTELLLDLLEEQEYDYLFTDAVLDKLQEAIRVNPRSGEYALSSGVIDFFQMDKVVRGIGDQTFQASMNNSADLEQYALATVFPYFDVQQANKQLSGQDDVEVLNKEQWAQLLELFIVTAPHRTSSTESITPFLIEMLFAYCEQFGVTDIEIQYAVAQYIGAFLRSAQEIATAMTGIFSNDLMVNPFSQTSSTAIEFPRRHQMLLARQAREEEERKKGDQQ